MEDDKLVKLLQCKLEEQQLILGIQKIDLYIKANKIVPYSLAITTKYIYYFDVVSYQKKANISQIKTITISAISQQMVLHYFDEKFPDMWFKSDARIRIIKNIFYVREKFMQLNKHFPLYISKSSSLQNLVEKQMSRLSKFQSVITNFFHNRKSNQQSNNQDISLRLSDTYQINYHTQKNFYFLVASKIYQIIYTHTKLLYLSGNHSFKFHEEKYQIELNSSLKIIYKKNNQRILLRKIPKNNVEHDKKIAQMLKNYKQNEYNQQILFALQTQTHFEIITRCLKNYLQDSISNISEIELRNIFHRLINLIQKNKQILHSLSNEHILFNDKNSIIISSVFCMLEKNRTLEYIAPEQFKQVPTKQIDIQLVNVWKIGILLYELAYGNVPFPIQYVAYCVKHNQQLKPHFYFRDNRSLKFQDFIENLIQKQPQKRGGIGDLSWKQKVLNHPWMHF